MDPTTILVAVAVVLGLIAVLLWIAAGVAWSRARSVDRVRVPAAVLHSTWTPAGTIYDVEYPGPDGAPLRGQVTVMPVKTIGQPYLFDGTVWVSRTDPSDITPRRWGRATGATLLVVFGGVACTLALGAGLVALLLAANDALGLPT